MAAIALVTANRISVVERVRPPRTSFAGAAIIAGYPVRYDANGKFIHALATAAANAGIVGIALHSVAIGERVSALAIGSLDGWDLTALAYGALIYLSDVGGLADVAGTVPTVVGRVHAAHGQTLGTVPDKFLNLNISPA